MDAQWLSPVVTEMMMRLALMLALALLATPLTAQEEFGSANPTQKLRLGLFGFGMRGGVDFEGDGQVLVGTTLDLGDLYTDRVRIRPSAELGLGSGADTWVFNAEALVRFVSDDAAAVPYVGAGLGFFGQEACDTLPGCPALWVQFAAGFEIRIREPLAWLLEYHAEDAFRRHRVFIGLTTRRGL